MKNYLQALAIFVLLSFSGNAMALVITPGCTPLALANGILAGSGMSVVPGSVNCNAPLGATGLFDDGLSSGIGIEKGLMISTGLAIDALGPNTSDSTSTNFGLGGDPDLDTLIPGLNTSDAVVLTFDFVNSGSIDAPLLFKYVFASEEYNEFVNSQFNDVFGFFLDGTNIALIPGTTTPVAINNVNCGNPYNPPAGGPNCDLFNNNDLDDGGPFFDIEYDGFMDVFTVSASVSPGTHTLKLAIADTSDGVLDSALFFAVPEPGMFTLTVLGLAGIGWQRRRSRTA